MEHSQETRLLGSSYTLNKLIGKGATGSVWQGVHTPTGTDIAAKILHSHFAENAHILTRFVQEKQLLTSLNSPYITRVYDLVAEHSTLAIVTEYVDGPTLRALLKQNKTLHPHHAAQLLTQLLSALETIHAQGIIHRDIKPDNIILAKQWNTLPENCLKLTDFGISSIVTPDTQATHEKIGTPAYMAPEIFSNTVLTPACDIYSAGILLYELLAGHPPFTPTQGNTESAMGSLAALHATAAPPPLPLPRELSDFLATLLDKHPERRPSATQALATLKEITPTLLHATQLPYQEVTAQYAIIAGNATIVRPHSTQETLPLSAQESSDNIPVKDTKQPLNTTIPLAPQFHHIAHEENSTVLHNYTRHDVATPLPPTSPTPTNPLPHLISQHKKLIFSSLVALIFLSSIGIWYTWHSHTSNTITPEILKATQKDEALPSGLIIERTAQWNPETENITLTITYSSQKATISGAVLETLGGKEEKTNATDTNAQASSCPAPLFTPSEKNAPKVKAEQNIPTITSIPAPCGWTINLPEITPEKPFSINVTLPISFTVKEAENGENPLQKWLDTQTQNNNKILANPDVHTSAYPLQRLQDIVVSVPTRIPSKTGIPVHIYPIWPSGQDEDNPIFVSPRTGPYTNTLTSIAGDNKPVLLTDLCGGATAISRDGETATALYNASNCSITATIGNFDRRNSNTFTIVGHDS